MENVASYFDLTTHGIVFMTFGYHFSGVKNLSGFDTYPLDYNIAKHWSNSDGSTMHYYYWLNEVAPRSLHPEKVLGGGQIYSPKDVHKSGAKMLYQPIHDLPIRREAAEFLRSYRSYTSHRYPAASCDDDAFMAAIVGDETKGIYGLPIYYAALLLSEPKEIGTRYPLTYEKMRRACLAVAGRIEDAYFRLHIIQIATAYEINLRPIFDDDFLSYIESYVYACLVYPMVLDKVRWLPTNVYKFLVDNAEEANKIRSRFFIRRMLHDDPDIGIMDRQHHAMMKAFEEGRIPKNCDD